MVRTVALLAEHIAKLSRELDALRIVADAARDQAAAATIARDVLALEVEALQAALAAAIGEKDRWHAEATRPLLRRLFRRRCL